MLNYLGMAADDARFLLALIVFVALIVSVPLVFKKQLQRWAVERPLLLYTIKRLLYAFVTLILIITVVFLLLRMFPKENYLDMASINKMPEEHRQAIIDRTYRLLGLDRPIWEQWFQFIKRVFPYPKTSCMTAISDLPAVDYYGNAVEPFVPYCAYEQAGWIDLGRTVKDGVMIFPLVMERAPISFKIAFPIAFFSMLLGYPLGVFMAKNRGKWVDQAGIGYQSLILAVPGIVLYGMIRILFLKTGWISVQFNEEDWLTYVPPIISGVIVSFSFEAYFIRRYIVDAMSADYVKFARSKGLSENRIMFTHVFRNALVYIIRYIPGTIIGAFMGGYFIEKLYGINGMGDMLITALNAVKPDVNVVQALVLIYAVMSMISYLLADLVVVFADPRISYTKNK